MLTIAVDEPLTALVCNASRPWGPLQWPQWKTRCTHPNQDGGKLCYHAAPWLEGPEADNQPWLEIERVMLERFKASPLNCGKSRNCRSTANVLVVPSVWNICGLDSVQDDTKETHQRFWNAVRQRARPSQLVVVHGHDSWDTALAREVLQALVMQPSSFFRRVVFIGMEDPLQHCIYILDSKGGSLVRDFGLSENGSDHEVGPADTGLWPGWATAPQFVVAPVTILADNFIDASSETGDRPFAMLFVGRVPVCCNDNRWELRNMLVSAGAECLAQGEEYVTCVICRHSGSALCKHKLEQLGRSKSATNTLSLAAHSTFCLEPLSDTLVRTHFYAAVLSGCIPVLFDGYALHRAPTQWAWRMDPPGLLDAAVQATAFHRFTVAYTTPYHYDHIMSELSQMAGLDGSLHGSTRRNSRVREYQRGLARVAPLMRYAPTDCGLNRSRHTAALQAAPCDAFSMTTLWLDALYNDSLAKGLLA
jgi:hypothetical protein